MKKSVVVSLFFEATHCWPGCPFNEVAFLKYSHRHVFSIELTKKVVHNDRDIEIILFKRQVESYLLSAYSNHDFGRKSCEDLAEELYMKFQCARVVVKEDSENGAVVEED
jgi:hypothetical protein